MIEIEYKLLTFIHLLNYKVPERIKNYISQGPLQLEFWEYSGFGQRDALVTSLKPRRGYLPVAAALDKQALTVVQAGGSDSALHSPHCSPASPGRQREPEQWTWWPQGFSNHSVATAGEQPETRNQGAMTWLPFLQPLCLWFCEHIISCIKFLSAWNPPEQFLFSALNFETVVEWLLQVIVTHSILPPPLSLCS